MSEEALVVCLQPGASELADQSSLDRTRRLRVW